MKAKERIAKGIVFIALCILAVLWIYPVFMILINSLKGDTFISTNTVFQLPDALRPLQMASGGSCLL